MTHITCVIDLLSLCVQLTAEQPFSRIPTVKNVDSTPMDCQSVPCVKYPISLVLMENVKRKVCGLSLAFLKY